MRDTTPRFERTKALDVLYCPTTAEHQCAVALGLTMPERFAYGVWTTLGTIPESDSNAAAITIEVAAYPARFYRFTIASAQGPIVVETGSGTLPDYLPTVRAIANSMLTVRYPDGYRFTEES